MAEPAPTTPVAASDVFGSSMSPAQAKAEIAAIINDPARGKLVATKVGWGEVAPPEVLAAKSQWNQLHAVAFPKPQQYSADEINKMPQHHDARRQAEMIRCAPYKCGRRVIQTFKLMKFSIGGHFRQNSTPSMKRNTNRTRRIPHSWRAGPPAIVRQ
jgi:hypothetical protein